MSWGEFKDYLSAISSETPLGRIVSIRSEEDPETLKHFTKEQHRIRNEWRTHKSQQISDTEMQRVLEEFKKAFISMAGGGRK